MNEIHYKNKKMNVKSLEKYGFVKNAHLFEYKTPILDGELELYVCVDSEGKVKTRITDTQCGDEYVLHLVDSATGVYVGKVKQTLKDILLQIYTYCFESEIYSANQAGAVIKHLYDTYGDKPDFPFSEETPVMRRSDNNKWYAIFMKIPAKKIGLETDEIIEIVNFKMSPKDVEKLVDGKHYFSAYHMNKKHWVTVPLDTAITTDELISRIDDSYRLTAK